MIMVNFPSKVSRGTWFASRTYVDGIGKTLQEGVNFQFYLF
jgi:hypothetical protein